MGDYVVKAKRNHQFVVWVTAPTPQQASQIALRSIIDGKRLDGVTEFWDEEEPVDIEDVLVDY